MRKQENRQKTQKLYLARVFFIFCCLFTYHSAYGQNHIKMEGADIRILFNNEPMPDQPDWRYGVIDVKLQPTWKTYWKNSGNSGLSPDLQLENGIQAELLFPTPHLLTEGKDWAYIYKDHAQILFRIAANEITDKPLKGNLLIGICDTICVPVNVDVLLDNKPLANFVDKLKIQTALNALPKAEDQRFFVKRISQKDKLLFITVAAPMREHETVLFLASKNAQIGVAHALIKVPYHTTFMAPILSGTLSSDDSIEFIAKQGEDEIEGKKKITKD